MKESPEGDALLNGLEAGRLGKYADLLRFESPLPDFLSSRL